MKCKIGRQYAVEDNLYHTTELLVRSKLARDAGAVLGGQKARPIIDSHGIVTAVRETFLEAQLHARMVPTRTRGSGGLIGRFIPDEEQEG